MLNLFSLLETTTDAATTGSPIYMTILIYGAIIFFMWFMLIRPQKKKQKETESMQSAIKVGDSVLTSGGFYGKVVDTVNDVLILEFGTNKTVRVPIKRSSVVTIAEPDLSINKVEAEVIEEEKK